MATTEAKSLKGIKQHPENPRSISGIRDEKLEDYLLEYGELSGLVVNKDGTTISANQRLRKYKKHKGKLQVIEQHDPPEPDGTIERGFVLMDGKKFNYRRVDWPEKKAKEAMIIANGQFGVWDPDILANQFEIPIAEMKELGIPDFVFAGADDLPGSDLDPDDLPDSFNLPEGDRPPFQQMTFGLADEQAQEIKEAINLARSSEAFKYQETFGNENGNGNALYLIVKEWQEQRT